MLTFAWPFAFILIPLLWIISRYLPGSSMQQESMLRVPFLSRIQGLNQIRSFPRFTYSLKSFFKFTAWILFVVAVSNPKWLGDPLSIKQEGQNIILAIDLSKSMEIPDLQRNKQTMNRLEIVKNVASDFIEKRQGDKIGLILFGSKAYLQTPLTFDRKTVQHMLNDATIGLAGARTAMGDAVLLAVKKLMTENSKSRILILMTDGANNNGDIDPLAAAEFANENKIKIYTIGIGATELWVKGLFGNHLVNPSADLDETLLKKIASLTQGQYFRAEDDKTLAKIVDAINELEPVAIDDKTMRPVISLFYWPLAASLIFLSLFLFPSRVLRT